MYARDTAESQAAPAQGRTLARSGLGARQGMTEAFFTTYCDEAWAYISTEDLTNGVDPEGFNLTQLRSDLAAL